ACRRHRDRHRCLFRMPIKNFPEPLATSFRILALFNDGPNINKPNKNMKTKNQIKLTPGIAVRRNLTTIPAGAGGRSETVFEEEPDGIRPFSVNIPEAELTELLRRIKATK